VLQTLPGFHLDGEEVIDVLEFASGAELVVEDLPHSLKVLE